MRQLLIEKFEENKFVSADREMTYWMNSRNQFHREDDLPAVIWNNGDIRYYKNGIYHRDGNKPALIYANGNKTWIKNGKIIKYIVEGKLSFYNNND